MDLRRVVPLALRATGNDHYIQHTDQIVADVAAGHPLHLAFARSGAFPATFIDALAVAEESGQTVESMGRLSSATKKRPKRPSRRWPWCFGTLVGLARDGHHRADDLPPGRLLLRHDQRRRSKVHGLTRRIAAAQFVPIEPGHRWPRSYLLNCGFRIAGSRCACVRINCLFVSPNCFSSGLTCSGEVVLTFSPGLWITRIAFSCHCLVNS